MLVKAVSHARPISLAIFLASLLLNAFLREPLYQLSANFTLDLQYEHSSLAIGFFSAVTMVSDPAVASVLILIILLKQKAKHQAYRVVVFVLMNVFLIGLMKAVFADPRPFWTDS